MNFNDETFRLFFITSRHDLSECKYGPIFIIGGYY